MAGGYVEPRRARHRAEFVDGVERLRIPYRRQWFVFLFVPFWLIMWTFGGIAAMGEMAEHPGGFLALWLCFWALGWVYAAATLVAQFGAELVSVPNGDLDVSGGFGPLRRTWRYRGGTIRNLQSATIPDDPWGMGGMRGWQTPFWMRPRAGAVRFDYGARTLYLAAGVDEPEGREIVAWLAKRLPRTAMDLD